MEIDRRVLRGDVIVGPSFEAARRSNKGTVLVGEPQGKIGEDASDPSRAEAMFVVMKASWYGEESNRTWRAYARRLTPEGEYDPDGEVVLFQNGGEVAFQAYVYIVGRADVSSLEMEQEVSVDSAKSVKLIQICKICGLRQDVDTDADLAALKESPCPVCVSTIGSSAPMSLVRAKV